MTKRALAPLCSLLLLAAPSLAQDGAPDEAAMAAWMAYMTPGEPHQKLAASTGNWSHTLQMWQAPGTEPMETTATSVREMTLGGRYMTEDFTGTVMGMPFEGRAVAGYDNARQKYFSTWIDNMGTGLMVAWGEPVEGSNTIEFHGTYVDPMTGQEAPFREVHTHMDESNTVMEMYMVGPDGTEFKSMEIHSTKQGG